jgi:hypothetical protein
VDLALIRGELEIAHGQSLVRGHAIAVLQQVGVISLRLGNTLIGRQCQVMPRQRIIHRNTVPFVKQKTVVAAGDSVALVGRHFKVMRRACQILGNSDAVQEKAPELKRRNGQPLVGRQRQVMHGKHARLSIGAVNQDIVANVLRFRVVSVRGLLEKLEGIVIDKMNALAVIENPCELPGRTVSIP